MLDNLPHSSVELDDPSNLEFDYTRMFAAAIDTLFAPSRPVRALHIGGGAFTLPLYLAATRPGSTNTVFEIDPAVIDVAKKKFGVKHRPAAAREGGRCAAVRRRRTAGQLRRRSSATRSRAARSRGT